MASYSCWFTTSLHAVELTGKIVPDGSLVVDVTSGSSPTFSLDTGSYHYEFNIVQGPKFTLNLYAQRPADAQGTFVPLVPNHFDPEAGTVARKAFFTLA